MFAIIKVGGKQYRVEKGTSIYVEKIDQEVGSKYEITDVLMVDAKIGNPLVKGASVTATVEKQGKQKKIKILKFQSKKHHLKRQGHRQPYTKLIIDSING